MQDHIQKTIDDIDQRIISLQSLRESLLNLDQFTTARALSPPATLAPIRPIRPMRPMARNGNGHTVAKAVRAPRQSGKRFESTQKQMAAARTLTQPFRADELARMSGISPKAAQSSLFRWKALGLVKADRPGQWTLTTKFPKGDAVSTPTPPAAPASVAAPLGAFRPEPIHTMNKIQLEQLLEKRLKERDDARAKGRESLETVYQKDIDRIERELESIGANA